jgi:hypothetical protein
MSEYLQNAPYQEEEEKTDSRMPNLNGNETRLGRLCLCSTINLIGKMEVESSNRRTGPMSANLATTLNAAWAE